MVLVPNEQIQMLQLQFPIQLPDDIQIFSQTDDGFYIITYKNIDGNNSVIWLPTSLDTPLAVDSNGGRTIDLVKKYLAKQRQTADEEPVFLP